MKWKVGEEKREKNRFFQTYVHTLNDFPSWEESVTIEVIDTNFRVKRYYDQWLEEIKEKDERVDIKEVLKSPKDIMAVSISPHEDVNQLSITRFIQTRENIQIISYKTKQSIAVAERINRWVKIITEINPTFLERKSGVRSITGTPESARGIRIGN